MKIVFCGGGTAGHVTPALAVAEELKKRDPGVKILFIGRAGGEEMHPVVDAGFRVERLTVEGVPRKLSGKSLHALALARRAQKDAEKILSDFNPDAVFATGGYVSFPVLRAAKAKRIPYFLHESNVTPGLVTRIYARGAKKIFLCRGFTCEKITRLSQSVVTGNPIRKTNAPGREKLRYALGLGEEDVFLLSFGGSGGAEVLNDAILSLMKEYSAKEQRVRHTHACGRKYFDTIREKEPRFAAGDAGCKIVPYLENVPVLLSAADLVISRAGAMSVSEIAAAGVPAILIPSPNVTGDHQRKNAIRVERAGGAVVLREDAIGEKLLPAVKRLVSDPGRRRAMRGALSAISDEFAVKTICDLFTKSILP